METVEKTVATPPAITTSTCRYCDKRIVAVMDKEGLVVPWWHSGNALEECGPC